MLIRLSCILSFSGVTINIFMTVSLTLYNYKQTLLDKYTQLNFMLNKLIKFMRIDDIGVVLDGNCFDEVVAVEEA